MPYLGNEPAVAYTSTTKDTFSGDASTTDFTMSKSANVNAVRVVVENVVQNPTVAYTCNGTTLSFTSAPPTGTNNIYVIHLGPPAATIAPPTTINNATTFTGGVTLKNETAEDTDGGRESIVTFQGTQSGNEITTLAQIQASHDGTSDDEAGDLIFKTNDGSDGASPTERLRIDSAGKVGIGTNSPSSILHVSSSDPELILTDTSTNVDHSLDGNSGTGVLRLHVDKNSEGSAPAYIVNMAGSEAIRIDSSGNLFIGRTSAGDTGDGHSIRGGDSAIFSRDASGETVQVGRNANDGDFIRCKKNGTLTGAVSSVSGQFGLSAEGSGTLAYQGARQYIWDTSQFYPAVDNAKDLGFPSFRFDDVHATNGTIQTSDENEKQNIASLTSAEITAATAISKLFKTFKWKDKVETKGDAARTHTGVIAQQVQTAMSDAGLDASKYAFWCSDTWWETVTQFPAREADEENGISARAAYSEVNSFPTEEEAPEGAVKKTRLGVRYPELLSFIGAATEQRLTSIEARLDALEAG